MTLFLSVLYSAHLEIQCLPYAGFFYISFPNCHLEQVEDMGDDDPEVSASLHPGLCGLRPGLREVAGIARILGGVQAAQGEVGGSRGKVKRT